MAAGLRIFATEKELHQGCAEEFVSLAGTAIEQRGSFHVALAGGNTPEGLYRLLATPRFAKRIDWQRLHLYFGDERCVPADDPASNFRMVQQALLNHIDIAPTHIHRVLTELPPEQAASSYESTLQQQLPQDSDGRPRFDLVLLGMGPDGHTASLFPRSTILGERERAVAAVFVEKLDSWRISLTLPTINRARSIRLLVCGEKKADVLRHVLRDIPDAAPLPVQLLEPEGELTWYVDKSAAMHLS